VEQDFSWKWSSPLDLQKEHDNKDIKTMWRNLGANLDEHNAESTAGILESRQRVYKSIDHDGDLKEHHFTRDVQPQGGRGCSPDHQ